MERKIPENLSTDKTEYSVQDFFKQYKKIVKLNSIILLGVDGKLQYDFSKSNDGIWTMHFENGFIKSITQGKTDDYTARVSVPFKDIVNVFNSYPEPRDAIKEGIIKIDGDIHFVDMLAHVINTRKEKFKQQ